MGQRQGPWLLQFWADGTGTPLVQVHHSRGQLHQKRRDRSHPEISLAGFLLTRPRMTVSYGDDIHMVDFLPFFARETT